MDKILRRSDGKQLGERIRSGAEPAVATARAGVLGVGFARMTAAAPLGALE
jgi:hypothetical protein